MAEGLYLNEFLFRGRPQGSDLPPEYHVRLAQDGKDPFGSRYQPGPALTPAQASDLGFDLSAISEAINATLFEELTAMRERLAQSEAESVATRSELEAVKAQAEALQRANDALLATLAEQPEPGGAPSQSGET